MKKLILVMLTFCLRKYITSFGTIRQTFRQGKKRRFGGGGAGKKSGSFATVWESEFDNKATRLAVCDGDGNYVIRNR